ncbi:MAG: hypothetical protein EXR55_01615 [Dehalococcoidia bacterium]|nr:hypothetical protein [Dehalococcoidia bacterium]
MFRRRSEPIRHQRVRELLSSYLDAQASERERELVERHVATCEACRRYQEELRDTVQAVRGLPQVTPPRTFTLAQAPRQRMAWALPSWGTPLATATAAALFAVLILGEVTGLIGSPVAHPTAMPSSEALSLKALVQPEAAPEPTPAASDALESLAVQDETPPAATQELSRSSADTSPPPPEEAAQPPLQVPLLPWLQGALGLLAVASGAWWLRRRRAIR